MTKFSNKQIAGYQAAREPFGISFNDSAEAGV